MKIFFMAIAIVFAMTTSANAEIYQQGVIYVIYDVEGARAVKNKADINSNGVPDVIEDIATQINAAREVFNGVFDFPDPLNCEHFKKVTSIEIDIESKAAMKQFDGLAYDRIRKKSKHNPNERVLYLKIANTTDPHKNSTAAHEYFHLVQYAANYFRNHWYLEGMARWSQDVVEKIEHYPSGWDLSVTLKSSFSEKQIYHGKYNIADFLWYPLAVRMKDKTKIPGKLTRKYKYVDGSPVFHDNIFYGPNIMLKILHIMKSKEKIAAAQFGGFEKWIKEGRAAEQNNKIILNCVREVYHEKF